MGRRDSSEWKIQLTMAVNFISSKDNVEIMVGKETNDIIEELFESLFQLHQKNLEE